MSIVNKIDSYAIGNSTAYIYRENSLTFRELKTMSDALACYISESLKDDGTPILVFGHKELLMPICFLACIKSGHPYIPIDSSMSEGRVKDIVENSNTPLILSVSLNSFNYYKGIIKSSDEIESIINSYLGKTPDSSFFVNNDEVYYIIYTSGSTGTPKGVMVTHDNVKSFIKWGLKLCKLEDKNIFMNQAPFSFDLSVMDLYLSLASGSTLYCIDKEMIANQKELFHYLRDSNITHWVSTPSFMDLCLSSKQFNEQLLPGLRQALFCGETLMIKTAKELKDRFKNITVTNSYGPTEATVAISALDITEDMLERETPLPVGIVKNDCKVLVIKDGQQVEVGEKGEITIVGDSVAKGYYNNEKMTEKSFFQVEIDGLVKRGYRTGDEGFIKDNMLHYSGRIDFQVKLNGYRIELEDIENNLRKVSIVSNAVVLPYYKDGKILYLLAMVVLNKESSESHFDISLKIKDELKDYLPQYMIPRKIIIKDQFPMNTNGKINRKQLMEEL